MGLRGHQLGYRPKTNSYDGWDVDQWEQYIRDLAVFGTNAIELIPPRSDDEPTSPHFPRPPGEMMEHMSKLADNYGLDVWIWYPAMDEDYEQEATVAAAIREWGAIFARLPRVDAVFVPGGDPGHTRPRSLFALLERQTESLRRYHPNASMWVSPQSFDAEGLEEFLDLVKKEPSWLGGIVFGPQVRIPLAELRQAIPARYPIRGYPDITHSLNCQHPVPNWDLAFALTQEREVINPRPLDQAAIFRAYQPSTVGFLTYSEGCNDDVNKMVWSGLGWDPQVPVIELLRQYGRYFVGAELGEAFAQGLLALERNWRGPLIANSDVEITLAQFQQLERSARPQTLANWRFQQALYRAYYDAYLRDRLLAETAAESEARQMLRRASTVGTLEAMDRAEALLLGPVLDPVSVDRRARIDALAEALFQSIQMQLDVTRYRGQEGRGTTQHTIDTPLSDRLWLQSEFRRLRSLDTEEARVQGIDRILDRTTPSPGGWYAQPGDLARAGQVVPGQSYPEDPDFRRSPLIGFDYRPGWPMAWCRNIQTLYDQPLQMRFDDLSPDSKYRVRIVYAGDNFRWKVRLEADGHEVHPFLAKPDPPRPLEFALPIEATGNGSVVLQFQREPGKGGNGRGCQVAEVWLEPVSP
jgi:hypothetical protein